MSYDTKKSRMVFFKNLLVLSCILILDAGCSSNAQNPPSVNADFKVESLDVSQCTDLPAPRKFSYFTYFIAHTPYDVLVATTPQPEYRKISRGMIMYGGINATNNNHMNDLWLLDITNHETSNASLCPWIKLRSAVFDEPRYGGRMIYQYNNDMIMMAGGYKHNSINDESTGEVFFMPLNLALSDVNERFFRSRGFIAPEETVVKVYGDTKDTNIARFSNDQFADDGIYEAGLCNTQQPDYCMEISGPNACAEYDNGNINSCGPSVAPCGANTPLSNIYEGCFYSPSCTLASTDNNIEFNPRGLAMFGILYNPLIHKAYTYGGTEGCMDNSSNQTGCANWQSFNINLHNQILGDEIIYDAAPFDRQTLSLMNNNSLVAFDLNTGNKTNSTVDYRQSPGVKNFIRNYWPEDSTLGLSHLSGAVTGLRWNISSGGWEVNSRVKALLIGGTFKQKMPPLFALDISERMCVSPQGCDANQDGVVSSSEAPRTAQNTYCYDSTYYNHYELFGTSDEEDYIHTASTIDFGNPQILNNSALKNEVAALINAEVVPFRFASRNPQGATIRQDHFMIIGGKRADGSFMERPVMVGEDPNSNRTIIRSVPSIGDRESVVAVTDTLEQAVFVFGGSSDPRTYKITLKEHGLDRNKGEYKIQRADIAYKLDDNATAVDTDDKWTTEVRYSLRYECEPSTLCFADKIALHLLNAETITGFNSVRVFATLPSDTACSLPAPQGQPRGLAEPDNYCHELTVHTLPINGIAEFTNHYKASLWNLPVPLADGHEIELVVQYTPEFENVLDNKYENFLSVGAGKFLMGMGAIESKGYAFNLAPVLVTNNLDDPSNNYFAARNQFEQEYTFNLTTRFILPPNYMGIAQGEPNTNHSEYSLTNPNEFKNYKAHVLQNVQTLRTVSDASLTPGIDAQSSIHIYGQVNVPGQNNFINNYINCPTALGTKYCLDYDLQRLQETLGPYHHQDMHLIHMARRGNTNVTDAVTVNGVSGILSYDELGQVLVQDINGPGYTFEQSGIVAHELCHNWFGSGVKVDTWLEASMCRYIAELNYHLDYDGDPDDETQFNEHADYETGMNSILHASKGTEDCGIREGYGDLFYETYAQGSFVMNQFYFATLGNGLLPVNSYMGYWNAWKNFLHQHRKQIIDSATLKAFMDSLLPPYVTATGEIREGFYADYVENACSGIPLLTLRDFSFTIAADLDPTNGSNWYEPDSSGSFTIEQVQLTNFTGPGTLSMNYFSYVPYYLTCSKTDDSFPTFNECYKLKVLKNNIETNPLTPSSFYSINQIAPMPTMADILQGNRLSSMSEINVYNRYYCGAYNQPYTAYDGSIVACQNDADFDGFKAPEDCGMVYPNTFDNDSSTNSHALETGSSFVDQDCNCYVYDGASLNYDCGEHRPLPDDITVIDPFAGSGIDYIPPEDLCPNIINQFMQGSASLNQSCSCSSNSALCVESACGLPPYFPNYLEPGIGYADLVSNYQSDVEQRCMCIYTNDVNPDAIQECIDSGDVPILPEDDCAVQFPFDYTPETTENYCDCRAEGEPNYDMEYCREISHRQYYEL